METEERFGAPWSSLTRRITVLYVGLLLATAVLLFAQGAAALRHSLGAGVALLAGGGLSLLLIVYPWRIAPIGYAVREDQVLVLRRRGPIALPTASIASAEVDEPGAAFRGTVRTGAMGGGFGFYGSFSTPGFGSFTAYATRTTGLLILRRTRGEPIVITPDDPARLIAALRLSPAGHSPAADTPPA